MFLVRMFAIAAIVACGAVYVTAAGAQAPAIDSARADIVGKPLVTGAIDLSGARPQPMPTLHMPTLQMPVDADGFIQLAQAKTATTSGVRTNPAGAAAALGDGGSRSQRSSGQSLLGATVKSQW